MNLLRKGRALGPLITQITPQSAAWRYTGFEARRLLAGESFVFATGSREVCMVLLRGRLSLRAGHDYWPDLGLRDSVFAGQAPYAVYLPPNTQAQLTALTELEIALCSAPAVGMHPVRLITPEDCRHSQRGQGSNLRHVCDILPEACPAEHLLVVEVITPAGHSSSYPPHKHDSDSPPFESQLEEIYYHRLEPQQGYCLQRVYTDDRALDEAMVAENHDVVLVPRGYHPVTVPHGYTSYYLNVMAGPQRVWRIRNDPSHAWMLPD